MRASKRLSLQVNEIILANEKQKASYIAEIIVNETGHQITTNGVKTRASRLKVELKPDEPDRYHKDEEPPRHYMAKMLARNSWNEGLII